MTTTDHDGRADLELVQPAEDGTEPDQAATDPTGKELVPVE